MYSNQFDINSLERFIDIDSLSLFSKPMTRKIKRKKNGKIPELKPRGDMRPKNTFIQNVAFVCVSAFKIENME